MLQLLYCFVGLFCMWPVVMICHAPETVVGWRWLLYNTVLSQTAIKAADRLNAFPPLARLSDDRVAFCVFSLFPFPLGILNHIILLLNCLSSPPYSLAQLFCTNNHDCLFSPVRQTCACHFLVATHTPLPC